MDHQLQIWLFSSYRLKYERKKASCVLPRTSFVLFEVHIQRDFPTRIVIPVSFFPLIRDTWSGHFLFCFYWGILWAIWSLKFLHSPCCPPQSVGLVSTNAYLSPCWSLTLEVNNFCGQDIVLVTHISLAENSLIRNQYKITK